MEISDVNKSYLKAAGKVAVAILLSFATSELIKRCVSDTTMFPTIALVSRSLGILIVGAAVLGRLGWKIQTWGGETPAELHNMKVFRWLYLIGVFFTALSIFL